MKVSLLCENLYNKLLFVNHAISNKSQMPILLNFLIKAKKGNLVINATDLEIGISVEIPAKVEEEGETTVPAKLFLELIGLIPTGKINLLLKKEGLQFIGEKVNTIFQTASPEDFPKLYGTIGEEKMIIKKEVVEKELPKIVFAASQDLGRPALSGVLLKEQEGYFLMVATDGYRLSLKKNITSETKTNNKKDGVSMIIPVRVVRELMFMGKTEEDIKMFVEKGSNQVVFSKEETLLIGRLIEADFPAFEKIIPTDFSTKTTFDKEELQKAVKVAHVFAREAANIIKLSILKDKIIISANTPSVGENTVEVDAQTQGEDNQIAFNARYLLDLFSSLTEETIIFEMTGPLNPGVFRIVNDDSFLHLIMPIRIQPES